MNALLTDLYELNMAASYLRRGIYGPATFSLFARKLPEARGFLVAAGVEACLDFLEDVHFESQDLAYLREDLGFSHADTEAFQRLRFRSDVWAVPEGRVVFADEPILEVTGPFAEAQLVETFLLNQVTFQTAIASKAARCVLGAQGRDLVDFGFRRTQGIEAGLSPPTSPAARLSWSTPTTPSPGSVTRSRSSSESIRPTHESLCLVTGRPGPAQATSRASAKAAAEATPPISTVSIAARSGRAPVIRPLKNPKMASATEVTTAETISPSRAALTKK